MKQMEISTSNDIVVVKPDGELLRDGDGEVMKFPNRDYAAYWAKKNGIPVDGLQFIYTNESRECKCSLCERYGDCYIQDKLQRLPRDKTNGVGLGLCPKLEI